MSPTSGSYYAAKFLRYMLTGMSAMIVIILPYKVLHLFGGGPILARAQGMVEQLGVPTFLGYLLSVAIALAAVAGIGWVLVRLIRSRSDRIPILRTFARMAQRFDQAFSPDPKRAPTSIVLVAWPNEKVRSVGMLMRQSKDGAGERTVATVFIPNSPNPMTGVLKMVDADLLEPTDWTVDDMLALAVSRGVLAPKGGGVE